MRPSVDLTLMRALRDRKGARKQWQVGSGSSFPPSAFAAFTKGSEIQKPVRRMLQLCKPRLFQVALRLCTIKVANRILWIPDVRQGLSGLSRISDLAVIQHNLKWSLIL
jgi:hypothetical protein